jgi:HK97 family phage portal protein
VYSCVRVLSETVAQLPLFVYERLERGKRRAYDHPLHAVLHDRPNPLMTAFGFWETLVGHVCLWGNGYAEIEYDNGGRPVGLWPLRPDQMVDIRRAGYELNYVYQLPDGKQQVLQGWRVFHARGLSGDGIRGYSPIRDAARGLVGMGLAVEEFGARFFRNGARPGGILQHPGVLDDDGFERLKATWQASYGGLSNAHRLAILEEGMTYQQVGVPPDEAQFLESMKFNRSQIASIYRVPPHMIGDLERATFSNIEQQSIEFKIFTMEPWLVRLQQTINMQLLGEEGATPGAGRYFAEFLPDALLRGDTASRYQAHAIAIQNGWMSRNEVREQENLNPFEGGDEYLVPMNMAPAEEDGPQTDDGGPQPEEEEGEGGIRNYELGIKNSEKRTLRNGVEIRAEQWDAGQARHELQVAYLPLYEDVAGRVQRREANDIGNASKRLLAKGKAGEFQQWLRGFWEEHEGFVARQYRPLVESAARQQGAIAAKETGKDAPGAEDVANYVTAYVEAAAARYVGSRRAAVGKWLDEALAEPALTEADDPEDEPYEIPYEEVAGKFEEQLGTWREEVPGQVAREESVRVGNGLALAILILLGVTRKTWVTIGENCPYCDSLGGRTIEIDSFFLQMGQSFMPGGADGPLVVGNNVGHAPAHRGCDCVIVAG